MHWIQDYQFIFFDFDGLLVNTEHLHFQAYQTMCLQRGYPLEWDFKTYCSFAHTSSDGLKNALLQEFPLLAQEKWDTLYEAKKRAYQELLLQGQVQLMPGVEQMMELIQSLHIPCCVVTNSFAVQTKQIARQIPLLQQIPHWITREDYLLPKPNPDPYQTALNRFIHKKERVIGFEDTQRGLRALQLAQIEGILISSIEKKPHFTSFFEFVQQALL